MESADAPSSGPRFEDLALVEAVARAVKERGYEHPTPVQAAVFEPASAGKDCVVQARTGTGKTSAFGLPLVSNRVQSTKAFCQALVLCPTRELALQVSRELQSLAIYTDTRVVSIYGGAPMTKQIEQLQQGAHIVVGTPGRVLDHLRRKTLNLSGLRSFVLDECDEMLSMGFLPQINDIWATLPQGHQTLLFSATMPKEVQRIAESRLRSPEFITLSGDHIGALEIQHFFYMSHGNKGQELLQLVEYENPESAILFCNTRDETKRIAKILQDNGYAAEWLNADLGQSDRERVMQQTQAEELRFLVCTDVAARGIDISHLTHVINVDFPDSSEQYVHRTGRTGRAGKIGTAISLVSPGSVGDLYYLRLKYKIHPLERHLPTREELLAREEADVLKTLAAQAAETRLAARYTSLARRMLTHDDAVTLVSALLAAQLGDGDAVRQRAEAARKAGRKPSAAAERAEAAKSAEVTARAETARSEQSSRGERSTRSDAEGRDAAAPRRDAAPRLRGPRGDSAARGDSGPRGDRPAREPRSRADGDRNRDGGSRPEPFAEHSFRYEVSDAPALGNAGASNSSTSSSITSSSITSNSVASNATVENDVTPRTTDAAAKTASDYVSLFLSIGKRDGARPEDVEGALNAAGIDAADTGRISVKLNHTFIEVRPGVHEQVIQRLTGREICGRTALVEVARAR